MFRVPSLGEAAQLAGAIAQVHVDVSVAREHVEARLAAALAAGGRIVDEADAPAAWILADRAGSRVCITAWPDGPVPLSWLIRNSALSE